MTKTDTLFCCVRGVTNTAYRRNHSDGMRKMLSLER